MTRAPGAGAERTLRGDARFGEYVVRIWDLLRATAK